MKIMASSFKRTCAGMVEFSAPDTVASHCLPTPPPETLGHSQASLVSLLWGHCSFLLALAVHKVLFLPFKGLFPSSCVSSVSKSHWPPKTNSPGVLSPFWMPRLENLGWALELSQQCHNFFGIIVLQFVGHLFGGAIQGLMATSSKTETGIPVLVRRAEEWNP